MAESLDPNSTEGITIRFDRECKNGDINKYGMRQVHQFFPHRMNRELFSPSDWVTIPEVWVRNPSNGETLTGVHQIFSVVRDDGSDLIEINPAIITSGPYQNAPSGSPFEGNLVPASALRHYHPNQQKFSTVRVNGKWVYDQP